MVKKFKELAISERPREKLRTLGEIALSDSEVLAILLRTGTKNKNVLELSAHILDGVGGIRGFKDVTYNELISYKGIGQEKALHILANIEFARRIYTPREPKNITCNSPEVIANYLRASLENLTQEVFIVLDIDTKGKILQQREVFKGSLDMSVVHPREVFKQAIRNSASSIVCIHNHPSSDPTPSLEDVKTTINLFKVGELLGIEVLDHIVVAKDGYSSIRRILNYFYSENIDYKNNEITKGQLKLIERKYEIVSEYE